MLGLVTVVAVGRMKTAHWRQAQSQYATRISRYTTFALHEVKDSVGGGFPDAVAVEREGESLLASSKNARLRILLTPEGDQMDSVRFSAWIQDRLEQHHHLHFLIGGPNGVSSKVKSAAPTKLSLSKMTFPHELARVVLLEQLYRAFTLLGGEKYHK
jgi:23S rRNA (pseudouridine1915-N3)-methyltransferase